MKNTLCDLAQSLHSFCSVLNWIGWGKATTNGQMYQIQNSHNDLLHFRILKSIHLVRVFLPSISTVLNWERIWKRRASSKTHTMISQLSIPKPTPSKSLVHDFCLFLIVLNWKGHGNTPLRSKNSLNEMQILNLAWLCWIELKEGNISRMIPSRFKTHTVISTLSNLQIYSTEIACVSFLIFYHESWLCWIWFEIRAKSIPIENSHNNFSNVNSSNQLAQNICVSFLVFYDCVKLNWNTRNDEVRKLTQWIPLSLSPNQLPPKPPPQVLHPMKDAEKRRAEFGKGLLGTIPRTDQRRHPGVCRNEYSDLEDPS